MPSTLGFSLPLSKLVDGQLTEKYINLGQILARNCHIVVEWDYSPATDKTRVVARPLRRDEDPELLRSILDIFTFETTGEPT